MFLMIIKGTDITQKPLEFIFLASHFKTLLTTTLPERSFFLDYTGMQKRGMVGACFMDSLTFVVVILFAWVLVFQSCESF